MGAFLLANDLRLKKHSLTIQGGMYTTKNTGGNIPF
jgi:hypothetical protein